MVFSSLSFLIVFLPTLIILFFLVPATKKNARQYVLLAFSFLFYGSGEPLYIFLIIGCILASWVLSLYVEKHCKWALTFSVIINVLPLIITKYAGFLIGNVCRFLRISNIPVHDIVMPIGISFYTFQVITYIVDLYKGKVSRQENPLLFALYIMFFPQLIAGPIVKYSEVASELEKPDVSWKNIKNGTGRFIMGLSKKVLIANQAGYIVNSIKDNPMSSLTSGMTWLCVIAYTIQIYFDFSGYSEMAIGLGAVFGFHFPENFDDPYTSKSVSEFWRRWHVTLGRFFREYVYIPLGGNRVRKIRWIRNIFIVWALTGLWHGASWNFVIWGLYYGILIIIEKVSGISKKIPAVLSWVVTFLLVNIGWAIFMCDELSMKKTVQFVGKLFFIDLEISAPVTIGSLGLWGYIPFLLAGLVGSSPLWTVCIRSRIKRFITKDTELAGLIGDLLLILALLVSFIFLIGGTYNPFIYYRF